MIICCCFNSCSIFLLLKKKIVANSNLYFVGWLKYGSKYICETCHKSYMHKGDLSKHKKYYCTTKNQFKCSHCVQTCSLFHNLRRHLLTKHGVLETLDKERYLISRL